MTDQKKSYVVPMIIIGALFFIFGFVTWLNSVLIPFLKQACQLTDFQAYYVTVAFYGSYFFMAIPASMILKKTGFAKGMSLGLLVMAAGSLIFIPAANARSFPMFLLGFFIQSTGLALLQTASNPYATILGPIESAAKRISILGICNKIAGMIGIFLLVGLLFSDTKTLSAKIQTLQGAELAQELDILASRVVTPYIIMAIVLVFLAIAILKAHLPEINPEDETGGNDEPLAKGKTSVFQFPHTILGALAIFAYVGVEVIAIDTIGLYGQYQGFDLDTAGMFGIYSLIALSFGYVLGIIVIPKYLSQRSALVISAVLGLIFAAGAMLTNGWVSIGFMVLLSFANSLMWPSIWPLAISDLGKFTKIGSALMIMGIVGGGILTVAYGAASDASNRQIAYWITLPCYLYVLYYAVSGYKAGKNKLAVSGSAA